MGQKNVKPDTATGIQAVTMVEEREGSEYGKRIDKLYKACDMVFIPGGRLQPELWRIVLNEKRGILTDKKLIKQAEAWLRTAKYIHKNKWLEQELNVGDQVMYVYHKCENTDEKSSVPSVDVEGANQPPPYPYWACFHCGAQNPLWSDTCYSCGAHRPLPKVVPSPNNVTIPSSSLYPMLPRYRDGQDAAIRVTPVSSPPVPESSGHIATPISPTSSSSPSGHIATPSSPTSSSSPSGHLTVASVPTSSPSGHLTVASVPTSSTSSHVSSPSIPSPAPGSHFGTSIAPIFSPIPSSQCAEPRKPILIYPVLNLDGSYYVPPTAPILTLSTDGSEESEESKDDKTKADIASGGIPLTEQAPTQQLPSNTSPAEVIFPVDPYGTGTRPKERGTQLAPIWLQPPSVPFTPKPLGMSAYDPSRLPETPLEDTIPGRPRDYTRGNAPHDAPTMYVTFNPSQAATLVAQLPDPEKQPMPFYRRIREIQQTYSASFKDLQSLCQIKAGDAYWPIMEPHLRKGHYPEDTTYQSGIYFGERLLKWAQDR